MRLPSGSLFTDQDVPLELWPHLLERFGVPYAYHLAEGDELAPLMGILIEGIEGEPVSPGRYARFWLDARDLPRGPRAADWLVLDDCTVYDVESVDDTLSEIARLVIKRSGQAWQTH